LPFTGINSNWRLSAQGVLPLKKDTSGSRDYDIFPTLKIGDNLISAGFESVAEAVCNHKVIIIDCYAGVFIDYFSGALADSLRQRGLRVTVTGTSSFMRPAEEIESLAAPFLGGDDPLFGKRTTLGLADLFNINLLASLSPDKDADINILAGPGASLAGRDGLLIYIDIPKNEIQFRARAGSISNLGLVSSGDPAAMYKRFYFFDWIVLNRHKQEILPHVDIFIDGQRPDMPVWTTGATLRKALRSISQSPFRTRPWFEPGTWGGTWILDRINGLAKNVPNYAWSFELITPENGIILESSSLMLELSFDTLMYQEAQAVLGDCHEQYGTDFPIRFDFLDTFDGGNLSLQCHPRPDYIKNHFGEPFTQEETYYILDAKEDSSVYLGFRDDIDPDCFREAIEKSFLENKAINPDKFILSHRSEKHDFFLIPYGTVHGSAKNNLVLEISTTPYIFTFKLYDWVRPDLSGKLRNLNISRGCDNLFFDRKGRYVYDKLISRPVLLEEGQGWKLFDLPTHETHSYSVHRYHFKYEIEINTGNKFLVMSLVEGTSIIVESQNGCRQEFCYAETFVIPAAAVNIRIINNSHGIAILVKAFIK
jgi:mannose-6-phosphate isomerase class I